MLVYLGYHDFASMFQQVTLKDNDYDHLETASKIELCCPSNDCKNKWTVYVKSKEKPPEGI